MRNVRLDWKGPYSKEQVIQMTGDDDFGVYQVIGTHVVFGHNSLLYIGRAVGVKFGDRFRAHEDWLKYESGIQIYLAKPREGDFKEDDKWEDWDQLVRDCEALCIYWHSPPYNSKGLNRYNGPDLRIHNRGERGSLLPDITSDWKPSRPQDDDAN